VTHDELPEAVRRFVLRAQAGAPPPQLVRLGQAGEMQLKPGRWLRFRASQEVRPDRVEFSWHARFRLAPGLAVHVRDWYRDGEGGLEARLLGVIPVARASGPETARSEAMRYLAELPWCPHAIANNHALEWREADDRSVEVATAVGSWRAAVTLRFDEAGDIVGAAAPDRPRQEGGRFVERAWSGEFSEYQELGGVRVPGRADVRWELPDGPFTYFRGRITNLELV